MRCLRQPMSGAGPALHFVRLTPQQEERGKQNSDCHQTDRGLRYAELLGCAGYQAFECAGFAGAAFTTGKGISEDHIPQPAKKS